MEILAIIGSLAAFVCAIIIIIDAFRNELWKGIVSIIFPLYQIYYMFTEFEHDQRWLIIAIYFIGPLFQIFLAVTNGS